MPRSTARSRALEHALVCLLGCCVGCASNVNDLLREARSGDPASVEEAVVEIGVILAEKEAGGIPFTRGDEAGVAYLIEVAEKSDDDLNRARAVGALGRLGRPELTELFLKSLSDRFWAVRLEAGKALKRRATPANAAKIAAQLEREPRAEVRIELIRGLAKAGGDDALKALLRVVFDRTRKYAHNKLAAYEAVRALSQKTYDLEDRSSWEEYYDERFRPGSSSTGTIDRALRNRSATAAEAAGPPS